MFEIHLFNRTEINNKATVNIQLKMKDIKFRQTYDLSFIFLVTTKFRQFYNLSFF